MNFKKIIISAITASSMILSTISVPAFAETEPTTNPWSVEKASEDTFRFGIMSDTHIAPGKASDTMQVGLSAFGNMGVDALALAGDISISEVPYTSTTVEDNLHTSVKAALETYKYEIKSDGARENDDEKLPMVYAMGNHELATNHQNTEGVWYAKELFAREYNLADLSTAQVVDGKYTGNYVTEMGGYKFIVASPNNGLEVDAFNSAAHKGAGIDTEGWVKEQIIAADEAYGDANKPIFYMQHIPVDGHYGKNAKANTAEFLTFLKNYPNVIVISAHTHNLIHDPRLISQDSGYTSIITGAMSGGQANVWNGNISGIGTGASSVIAQQMAIDVDYDDESKTSNIKVYRMDVRNNEFIGDPYEFTLNGEAQTKYSTQRRYEDEGRSTAAWNEGATLTATAERGTRNVTVTYPTSATSATVTAGANADVLQDDFLWGYKIFAVNKDTGIADKTSRQAFEFFQTPKVNERTITFENLARNQEYDIKAYPITVFQYADTYEELDAAGVTPLTQTVKTYNVKSDEEIAQQMTRNVLVSGSKKASFLQHEGTTSVLTDGDKYTFTDELWVDNTPGVGFVIDLERSYKISNINLVAYESNESGRNEFIIYGSRDNVNWTPIYERKSSDVSDDFGKSLAHKLNCDINDDYYRYIKIRYFSYTVLADIEVYADVQVTNVAKGAGVDASDTVISYVKDGFPLSNAVDGNDKTALVSTYDTDYYHYLQLDLGKKYPVGMVEYQPRDFSPSAEDTNAKSKWVAYGSNTVSDRTTLQTFNPLDTSIYTALTVKSDSFFTNSSAPYTEMVIDEQEYQYITVRKTATSALHMGEFRVFVINPEVADFAYTDGTASLTFTDAMNFENINDDIIVYDSEGNAKTVTFTPNADNTALTFAAEAGDMVFVSQNISNVYGIGMHEDASFEIYDLSIDYSGKTKKKFENVNVAYGKDIETNDTNTGVFSPEHLVNGEALSTYYISNTDVYYTIDLGRGYNVNKIVLSIPQSNDCNNANYRYSLAGSADGKVWDTFYTVGAVKDDDIWTTDKKGVHILNNDVNYRYIRYSNTQYIVLSEIEVYADVDATQVTKSTNTVTSSATPANQIYNKYLVDDYPNLTYVSSNNAVNDDPTTNTLYNWISVEMDQAYPIGMYELYVRDWKENGSHFMDGWHYAHKVNLYGSNVAPTEQLDENTENLNVGDLTPWGFDKLADTQDAWPFSTLFPADFGKQSLMPEGWIFTNGYKETLNNTKRYKNLTLKKYDTTSYTIEYGEFKAYVLNATVNAVDADANGVDIHFGDKMVSDLLNDETVTLTKDGVAVDFKGTLSENGMVYTLDATLADGFYTLTVADDVKNTLGVPMQADYTYEFKLGPVYGITTDDGKDVNAITANTTYVVTEPVSGNNARIAIAAIYDATNNVLVASAIENIPADYAKKYAEVEITTPETLPEGSYYVRYFLWDATTLMPTLNESIRVFE